MCGQRTGTPFAVYEDNPRVVIDSVRSAKRAEEEETNRKYAERQAIDEARRKEEREQKSENHRQAIIELLGYYGIKGEEAEAVLPFIFEDRGDNQVFHVREGALIGLLKEFKLKLPSWKKVKKDDRPDPYWHSHKEDAHHPLNFNPQDEHNSGYLARNSDAWGCGICNLMQAMYLGMIKFGAFGYAEVGEWDEFVRGWIASGNKPATKDISKGKFQPSPKGSGSIFLMATKSFTLLSFKNMKIIVPKGVEVRNMENIGEGTTLYFMDGFRVVGKQSVPVFANTLMSESEKAVEKAAEEKKVRRERRKRWPILGRFVRDT